MEGARLQDKLKKLLYSIHDAVKMNGNVSILEDSLKHIMNLCANIPFAKDVVRDLGGLSYLFDFVCSTSNDKALEIGLKALSCIIDENVSNQMELTKNDIFLLIRDVLARMDIAASLMKSVVLFTSTLLYQNVIAQDIFEETGCLQCFVDLYQEVFPPFMLGHVSVGSHDNGVKSVSTEMWQAVNTALCFSMINPVNVRNQRKCAKLLPVAMKILQCSSYNDIVSSISTLLSSLIVDNKQNLFLLVQQNGLSILNHFLKVGVMSLVANSKSIAPQDRDVKATLGIVGVIDLCIAKDEGNAQSLSKSDTISLLSKLLFLDFLSDNYKTKILLTLGHFIEADKGNISLILAEGDLKSFFKNNCQSSNEDLLMACQYIIHMFLLHGSSEGVSRQGIVPEPVGEDGIWNFDRCEEEASCVTELHAKRVRKSSSLSSSSEKSSNAQSKIALGKMKLERINQYLQQQNQINHGKTPFVIDTSDSKTISKFHARTNALSNTLNKVKTSLCFSKKLGSHSSLSKGSRMTSCSNINHCSNAARYNHTKSSISELTHGKATGSMLGNRQSHNGRKLLRTIGFNSSTANVISEAQNFSYRPFRSYGRGGILNCKENDTKESQVSLMDLSIIDDIRIPCHRDSEFAIPAAVSVHKRSIAVQMPTPIIVRQAETACEDDAVSCVSSAFDSHIADKIARNKRNNHLPKDIFPVTEATKEITETRIPSHDQQNFNSRHYSQKVTNANRQVVDGVASRKISPLSPFEKYRIPVAGSNVDVITVSPTTKSAAKRLASDVIKNKAAADKKVKAQPNPAADINGNSSLGSGSEPYFNVLLFPATRCPDHGLISSIEKLWFKPIKDKHQ